MNSDSELYVVFGTGPLGLAVVRELGTGGQQWPNQPGLWA